MDGKITVTDKRGGIILVANIWMMVFMCAFSGRFSIPLKDIRVFIDANEILKPEWFEDREEGG